MGMFDSFNLANVMAPDGRYHGEDFQTKELRCDMDQFLVTRDGRLVKRTRDDDGNLTAPWVPVTFNATVHLSGPIELKATFAGGRLMTLEQT